MLRRLGLLQVHQLSSFDCIEQQLETLRRVKPQLVSAYGIGLELISEAVVAAGLRDIRPRIVYTSGTALSQRGRALAEEAFGVRPLMCTPRTSSALSGGNVPWSPRRCT